MTRRRATVRSAAGRGRGRDGVSGSALLSVGMLVVLGASACGDGEDPRVEAVPDYREPEVTVLDEGSNAVKNRGPRERLEVKQGLPEGERVDLLFLDGRAGSGLEDGRSAWADLEGDRALIFDGRGRVERILQGGADEGPSLADPVTVVAVEGGLRVEERDGGAVLFEEGGSARRMEDRPPEPVLGGGAGVRLAARSVLYIPLRSEERDAPLLWRMDEGEEPRPLGRIEPAAQPMLTPLENSGWAAPAPDGGVVFASAPRPELHRFDEGGNLRWRASWSPDRPVEAPRFVARDGSLHPDFPVIHHGVRIGPDGKIYVLAAAEREGRADRLLVFTDDGHLLREAAVPPGHAIFAGDRGAVYSVSKEAALSRTPDADRASFRAFDRPSLDGEGTVRLEDHLGKVVVVNFWASWCPPCRRELPELDALARELEGEDVVIVGLNEDARPQAGLDFIDEVGGVVYPNAAGRGELRSEYGYRGLPYTVILDREHRVAQVFYGFGSSIEPIRNAVLDELARDEAIP